MGRPATASGPAHKALHEAIERTPPPCLGDARFTADEPALEELAHMARLCALCPVRSPCAEVARVDRVTAGFWAGRSYPIKTTTRKETHAKP